MHNNKIFLWVILFTGLGTLSCSRSAKTAPDPATRQTYCNSCKETYTLPLGYLGTLSEEDIHFSRTGAPVFICPECGEQSASPVPPPTPPTGETP